MNMYWTILWFLSPSAEAFHCVAARRLACRAATTSVTRFFPTTVLGQAVSSSSSSSSSSSDSSKSTSSSSAPGLRQYAARDLIVALVEDECCFTTEAGARAWGAACDPHVVYEDRFEPQPIVGRTAVTQHLQERARQRQQSRGGSAVGYRVDQMSDGTRACGWAWTWTCGREEGLRGTTFVQLNENTGLIEYVQEIPEPIFKPGDWTKQLLQAVTAGAVPRPTQPFLPRTPTTASDMARYLYVDLQNADPVEGRAELLRFLDDQIIYRDFNYEHVLRGPAQVQQFVQDFTFPGIQFRPRRFDDGVDSTCFTWEVVLDGAPDTIQGMSFYELDPVSRKIVYVRDVPESAVKPPILGKLARQLRPGLGVFRGVPLGSRPGGR